MTKLVESIAKSLVEYPDSVVVTETKDDQGSVPVRYFHVPEMVLGEKWKKLKLDVSSMR